MIGKKKTKILPTNVPFNELPSTFNTFFIEKIEKIRAHLDLFSQHQIFKEYNGTSFSAFTPVTEEYVKSTILKCKKSFSELDPLPAKLFYECLDILLPYVTNIFNDSLVSGTFPSDFKDCVVIPLLKKVSLDCNILKNYRPVSNLPFISKVLERIAYAQILDHLTTNELTEKFQSAYKARHSSETALLRVVNDMLSAIDGGNMSLLTLLDLSAAFDTIDHTILSDRLETSFGINGTVLNWIQSYLSNRQQKVKIDNTCSSEIPIMYGVPQGSVLGPLLFTMYVYPLTDVIKQHEFPYHLYADDTQLYRPISTNDFDLMTDELSKCTDGINKWMNTNKLKMNNDKTELLLCGTHSKLNSVQAKSVKIGNEVINYSKKVKNLGMFFENNLSMNCAVSHIRKCCYLELRKIAHLRSYINEDAAKTLVLSFVISRLDYCNSLFYNMTNENIHKLQLVQNHAARLVKRAPKRSSASSLLKELHWLPVKQRIIYKIAVLVYNCLYDDNSPLYLKELINIYIPQRTLRSSQKHLLVKPLTNLKTFGERSFAYAAPDVWNKLPDNVKSSETISIFKKRLKTHLFRLSF